MKPWNRPLAVGRKEGHKGKRAERTSTEIYLTAGIELGKRQQDLHRGRLEGVQHRPPRLLCGDPSVPLSPAANQPTPLLLIVMPPLPFRGNAARGATVGDIRERATNTILRF